MNGNSTWNRKFWNQPQFQNSLLFTYLWGLAAHGYMFLSNALTHDSMNEMMLSGQRVAHRIELGRIFVPLMRLLRGKIAAPWLVGLVGLGFIAIAVYLITRVFDVENRWVICLTSGILTVNLTVIALIATYIHDFDADSLALLCAVLGVFLWKNSKKGFLYGSVAVMASLGLYQSQISVTITLVLILCILWLLEGRPWKTVLVEGCKAIAMLILGGILYLCAMKLVTAVSGTDLATGGYNTLDKMLLLTPGRLVYLCLYAWFMVLRGIHHASSSYPAAIAETLGILAMGACVVLVGIRLASRKIRTPAKVLTVVLCALLPLGANVSHVLSNGESHDLMREAFWLVYLLLLLLAFRQEGKKKQAVRWISAGLVAVILWGNVQVANGVYTGKRFVQDANLSLFTRITYRMEQFPGYVSGETPVAFIGKPTEILMDLPEEYQRYQLVHALDPFVNDVLDQPYYQQYYQYVLMNPAVFASDGQREVLMQREDVAQMPNYPATGSMAMVEGILVVKLGDYTLDRE